MELNEASGPKAEEKGKLLLVDPNPPGRDIVPQEDLFMYVKFRAIARSRSVILKEGDTQGSGILNQEDRGNVINFIATNVKYGDDGKTILNDGFSYATTDWTQIGGLNSGQNPGGLVEGFGIKSIDIKYNASLVPVVDITFVDVRGASLFDVIDQDNRKSPYSIFFKLPYPIFELSLKGYFGKTVKYCLHMTKWTSNFDGTTGNFEIKANFMGFQQAFLADINMQNVIGALNTDEGKEKLVGKKISVQTYEGNGVLGEVRNEEDTPAFDTFLNDISRLQIDLASIKSSNEDFQKLKAHNTTVNLLEEIQGFIGRALPSDDKGGNKDFKDSKMTNTDKIGGGSGLRKFSDYLSIRDFIVVKETKKQYFDQYARTVGKLVEEYKRYIVDEGIEKNADDVLSNFIFNLDTGGNLKDISPFIEGTGQNGEIKFIDFATKFFEKDDTDGCLYHRLTDKTNFEPNNEYEDPDGPNGPITSRDVFLNEYTGEGKFSDQNFVLVYDFSKMRDEIEKELADKKQNRDELKQKLIDDINVDVSKSLGFNPTIGDVFHIIMNNVQVMLELIYDISVKAEELEKERFKDLQRAGVITDIPGVGGETQDISQETNKKIYAWPGIYGTETKGGTENLREKWLGDENIDETNFPEIKFVKDVVKGYLQVTEELKENRELVAQATKNTSSDNWLPINPIDIGSNPFSELSTTAMWDKLEGGIPKKLIDILITRAIALRSYSNLGENTNKIKQPILSFGKIEGATAAVATVVPKYLELLNEAMQNTDSFYTTIKNYGKKSGLISESNGKFKIIGGETEINDQKISGNLTDNGINFLYAGVEANSIIGNDSYLEPTLQTQLEKELKNIKPESPKGTDQIPNGIFTYGANNLYKHNISYLVFPDEISKKIQGGSEDGIKPSGSYRFSIDSITKIDDVETGSAGTNQSANLYIGKDFKGVGFFGFDNTNFLDAWNLNNSNKYSQCLILLNTMPFLKFGEVVKKFITDLPEYNVSKVIELPAMYVAWVGGTLWRYSQTTDPVQSTATFSFGDKDEYINSVGGGSGNIKYKDRIYNNNYVIGKKNDDTFYEFDITKLPKNTKDTFINFFIKWTNDNFNRFLEGVEEYLLNGKDQKLLYVINNQTNLVVATPKIFNNSTTTGQPITNVDLEISEADLENYIQNFAEGYKKFYKEKDEEQKNPSENDDGKNDKGDSLNNSDIYASVYGYFKEIYDKWIGGTDDGRVFNICGGNLNEQGQEKKLIDYFNFIDRGWNDISDVAAINLDSVTTLADNTNTNLYYYISKILRDSNFILQILPNFINFKDAEEVKKMFTPITDISDKNKSSGPAFVCIYAGGQSKSLNIGERYEYSDDSFDIFTNPPKDIESGNKNVQKNNEAYKLVAFRVAFGSENQTIFKNVSLNQDEHKTTGEYIKQLSNLVDKRSGVQRIYQGTDLYSLFRVRSYSCKVDAMGCMNIQPLMYFQLDNVPFYNGSYLITSVNHSITPNHISTSFTGLRQSSFVAPVVDNATTFLNIDFDEEDQIPQRDQITNLTPPQSSTYNKDYVIQNPEGLFPFNTEDQDGQPLRGITAGTLRELGVTNAAPDGDGAQLATLLNKYLPLYGITTNAKVCNFMAQCLYESDRFKTSEELWNPRNPGIITDGNITPATGQVQRRYENREDLGNGLRNGGEINDGYRFRGGGYLRILGRNDYTKLSKAVIENTKPFENILEKSVGNDGSVNYKTDEVRNNVKNALLSALEWYTKIGHGKEIPANQPQKKGTVEEAVNISSVVDGNNSPTGIKERMDYFEKCADVFGIKGVYEG